MVPVRSSSLAPQASLAPERAAGAVRGRWLAACYMGSLATTAVCALPVTLSQRFSWEDMNAPVLIGTLAMTLATWCKLTVDFSGRAAWRLLAVAFVLSWSAEAAGVRWGVPFGGGGYHYHPQLRPMLPGDVPLMIPLAWFVLAAMPLVLLRRAGPTPPGARSRPALGLRQAMLAAVCLLGFDLMLDPLAVNVQGWTWHAPGAYYGIPAGNFAFWFLIGLAIYLTHFALDGAAERRSPAAGTDAALALGNLALVLLAAAASLQRLGSALPVVLTLAVTGPFWAYWLLGLRREAAQLADNQSRPPA